MPSKQDQWNRAIRAQQIADQERECEKAYAGNKPVRPVELPAKKQTSQPQQG